MKATTRTLALLALVIAAVAAPAFGQGLLPSKIWTLTINVNVPNATIYIDNAPIQGNVVKVSGGPHVLRVHADGYMDVAQNIAVRDNMFIPVRLNPQLFPLIIRVTAPNASIFVDGNMVTGTNPLVMMGSHTIQVTAPGFQDYNTVINVSAPFTLDVPMQPAGFLLTVNSNVNEATVIVNNLAKGAVPYSEYLPPGTYTVRVSAAGYLDYIASVALDRAINMSAPLKPIPQPIVQPSTLSFVIPPIFRDPNLTPGDPTDIVRIFVDNRLVNPNRELARIAIAPGRHQIRVSSGSFSVQLGDITVQPGMSYIIELALDMKVRAVQSSQ
jgi:hypothetical protein